MAKWRGKVGYAITEEKPAGSGIWMDTIVERTYSGDLMRYMNSRLAIGESINDDLSINNQISILADPFAYNNFYSIKFAEFMGTAWKVTNVEVQRPRLLLTLGGVWNGGRQPEPGPDDQTE